LLVDLLNSSTETWGFVPGPWLAEQARRWGLQTHHIQLKASIVLDAISANGLTLDAQRTGARVTELECSLKAMEQELRDHGYMPGQKGCDKALQAILTRLERAHPECDFPRTASGKYSKSAEAIGELAATVPFLTTLFKYNEVKKLLSCYFGRMRRLVVHPSFNVLARTGRTTSFGEINAQNLPRDDGVRGCFVPSAGNVYIKADYSTIEMATLAQSLVSQFGLRSAMADAINAGKDLHRLVAAQVMGKPEERVTGDERQKAKPINFGKPGGMGNATLKSYAKASYGVALDDVEVQALSQAWFALFPEMTEFLKCERDLGADVAMYFNLTPFTHYENTGRRKFIDHPANDGRSHFPHPFLGRMCRKVLKSDEPQKVNGQPYSAMDIDYFWTAVEARVTDLPKAFHARVSKRKPSVGLARAVMNLVGRAACFTLTGRLRAGATYAARHNTVFQGLAADGAKLALWKLWRAGYRLVNFIHDEVLVEVPANSDLLAHAERVRRLMIEGMCEVVPDVRVDVEYAACERWYKNAKPVFNEDRTELRLWQPRPSPD
jgi:DNA polymerase I-like protein with 3'-5' exonuclease and polymerase domains